MAKENKIIDFDRDGDGKVSKAELALKMIEMQGKINSVEDHAECERRKIRKDFDRKIKEVKVLALGNKKEIRNVYRRTEDNVNHIEKLQGYIQWTIKTILGLLLSIGLTLILNSFLGLF